LAEKTKKSQLLQSTGLLLLFGSGGCCYKQKQLGLNVFDHMEWILYLVEYGEKKYHSSTHAIEHCI
jgi:hypothetical protein